jgi:hypothetical protein
MAEVAAALKDAKAGEVNIILETAFCSTVTGKTLQTDGALAPAALTDPFGANAAVFLAAQGSQPANVMSELKGSLFTYYVLEAVTSDKGDTNKDQLTTMKEAFMHAANKVKSTSQFRGKTQQPQWLGNTNTRLVLKGSYKEDAIEAVMTQLGAESVEEVQME